MKVTIVYGFLGAGKTTLLRSLVPRLSASESTALLVNEFGAEGVDQVVLASEDVTIRELVGGCVCCEVRGELLLALDQIRETVNPDRLVIEPTGLASPEMLANVFGVPTVQAIASVDSIITVLDATKFALVRDTLGEFYPRQVSEADLVLINKMDVATGDQLREAQVWVRGLNPAATMVNTSFCDVEPDVVVAAIRQGKTRTPYGGLEDGGDGDAHDGLSELGLQRVVLDTSKMFGLVVESFVRALADGAYGEVVRAKGFLPASEGSSLVDVVLGDWDIRPFGPAPLRIDVIGRNLRLYEMEQELTHGSTEFTRAT
jgi:G3E family GTPase